MDDTSPMSLQDRTVLLSSPLGRELEPRDIATLLSNGGGSVATVQAQEIVRAMSTPQQDFLLLLDGKLEVARPRSDGARHLLDVISPGGVCGAVSVFTPGARWQADVLAVERSRVLSVNARALTGPGVGRAQALVLRNLSAVLAARASHLNGRLEMLSRRGLRERIAWFLLSRIDAMTAASPGNGGVVDRTGASAGGRVLDPVGDRVRGKTSHRVLDRAVASTTNHSTPVVASVQLTRQGMADLLQVSRSSMTRELGRMVDDGLICFDGRNFRLVDLPALRTLAA